MIAIKGARVLTMDTSGVIDRGTILVNEDRIKSIGKDVEIPEGTRIMDFPDGYITPGFIDAHTHIGLEEEIYQIEGDDVNESTDPITPYLQALDGINFFDLAFADALRGGVCRTMCMPGSANILGGQAVMIKNFATKPSEMVYRNPWGLKAALGENPKRVYGEQKKTPKTRMASASLLREALYKAVRSLEKDDTDAANNYKQAAIIKVLKKEMPLMVHAHRADDILTALRIKDEFDIDMIIQHGTEAFKVKEELIAHGVPVFLGPLLVNRAKVELKDISFRNAAKLAEAGVVFSLVTDHPVIPIEHLRVCAALAVREGLDEQTALAAISITPAKLLKVDDEIGSLAVGKRADLVVFDHHPFDFRSRVKMVMVDGKIWGG